MTVTSPSPPMSQPPDSVGSRGVVVYCPTTLFRSVNIAGVDVVSREKVGSSLEVVHSLEVVGENCSDVAHSLVDIGPSDVKTSLVGLGSCSSVVKNWLVGLCSSVVNISRVGLGSSVVKNSLAVLDGISVLDDALDGVGSSDEVDQVDEVDGLDQEVDVLERSGV